jgi:UDP-glucose 4-epimerase
MKILTIGSRGFIGSHVVKYFREQGHDSFGCDVVVEYNDLKYFQIDPTNSSFEAIFKNERFDVCVNCSGSGSVPDSFVHAYRDFYLNTHNVYQILDAIRQHNPQCKFLNLSSAAVYGNPEALPVKETMAVRPLSPYGIHKHFAEVICSEFYNHFGIATASLRIFSAFGPGLKKQLFWDWSQKIKNSSHIILFGTGNESRDFIFIDDLVKAIAAVITHAEFKADVINAANGEQVTIKQAISIFERNCPERFTYAFNGEVRHGDPINWLADISRLRAFGYKPSVSFESGIKAYIKWVQEER